MSDHHISFKNSQTKLENIIGLCGQFLRCTFWGRGLEVFGERNMGPTAIEI